LNNNKITIIILLITLSGVLLGDFARDIELAQRYIALQKYEDAQTVLEKLYSERPENESVRNMLKQVYRATKDNEALLLMIEQDLATNPENPRMWADAGQLYLSLGRSDKAIGAFDTALELAPNDQSLIMSIFSAYRVWGYIDEGIDLLLDARKAGEDEAAYAMEIASMFEILGNWDDAADEYGRYLQKYPDRFKNVENRMNEVSADPEALSELEKAVEKLRDTGVQGDRIDRLLARLQVRQGEYLRAARSLIDAETKRGEKGIYVLGFMREIQAAEKHEVVIFAGEYLQTAEPRFAQEASLIMAVSLRGLGRLEESETILTELKNSKTPSIAAAALTVLGQIALYDSNDLDAAEKYFSDVLKRYPKIAGTEAAYRGLTDVHLRRGDFESAEIVLKQRRDVAPQDPWALYGLGELTFFRGIIDTAAGIFRAVALSFPKSEEANNAVAYLALIVDAGKSESIPQITDAFKLMRQDRLGEAIAVFDNLIEELEGEIWLDLLIWNRALLLLEVGNEAAAKKDLKNIAENYIESFHAPMSLEILGDSAVTEGDLTLAVQYYNRILIDYPVAVNIERIRDKMRNMPGNI